MSTKNTHDPQNFSDRELVFKDGWVADAKTGAPVGKLTNTGELSRFIEGRSGKDADRDLIPGSMR